MGVGYAVDLVVCSCLGVDMYDCVFPTRTARFGTCLLVPISLTHALTLTPGAALVMEGTLQLKHARYAQDYRPIDPDCGCLVCKKYV